jgi:pyruvate formate lyase activating enzyme
MPIKGLQKLSMIDYPDRLSAVVFFSGCDFRCPFCHNPDLVLSPEKARTIPEEEVLAFLKERKGWLDGVVLTGGEPTLERGLEGFITRLRGLGYLVKLDTNGSRPQVLEGLLGRKLLDFIAMDIKGPPGKYSMMAGVDVDIGSIERSISLIRGSGLDYEFRTTVVPGLTEKGDITEIGRWLRGSKAYFLQQFRQLDTIDPEYRKRQPYAKELLLGMAEAAKPFFGKVGVRGV